MFFLCTEIPYLYEVCGSYPKGTRFPHWFNILSSLTNPGTPVMQFLGVYDGYLVEPAQVLINLGIRRGMVVYGQDYPCNYEW